MIYSEWYFGNDNLPLLATAIHNGHQIPSELKELCAINEKDRLREEDPYTSELATLFPNYIVNHTSRFAVDLNRPPEKAVYLTSEDCWGLNPWLKPLPKEYLNKLYEDYNTWYALLRYQIERMLKIHPFLIILDLHSYNYLRNGPETEPEQNTPDIIIGRSNLKSEYYPLIDDLRDLLLGKIIQGNELNCQLDVKFTGGNLSQWLNSHFSDYLICLAIEFKKIFMDEWTGELYYETFNQLKDVFKEAIASWLQNAFSIQLG
ncbi:MAG: N-formylglutamate amidohydrolase [Candidatus Cloacimonadaceae bacterium]|jgi:N-formylglutamate deformylase|nr:N-formylglutamate amidohydrolase [Candidatus Cloacimonadota bacterium]MDD5624458.1 N-formylglutamate amidohydrolase [Candidatus Cloacimonadota bacterium]MDY0111911.1 N-formylglutamate amidohydrolase [Candidatus Syntrophosphaera sp.]